MGTAPFEFFPLHVLRTERISPSVTRVTLGGPSLVRFASGGRDQRFKLFLPHPGQHEPLVPTEAGTEWFPRWRAMAPSQRAVMRSYSVRALRHDPHELDIDFALHGDTGPASRWAGTAQPGDRATVLGPVEEDNGGVDFRPPPDTDWTLLTGDETALPALAGILAWLPRGARVRAWIEVPHRADRQQLPTRADAEITWLFRDELGSGGRDALLDALRATTLSPGVPYAWIAGESGTVRALRRHLVRDRGVDRSRVTFTGYWRRGTTEEQLVEEAVTKASARTQAAAQPAA